MIGIMRALWWNRQQLEGEGRESAVGVVEVRKQSEGVLTALIAAIMSSLNSAMNAAASLVTVVRLPRAGTSYTHPH